MKRITNFFLSRHWREMWGLYAYTLLCLMVAFFGTYLAFNADDVCLAIIFGYVGANGSFGLTLAVCFWIIVGREE